MSPASLLTLRCVSFHSVKGGVGKSTLAWLTARRLARDATVLLVDLDLTGTSLADVLDLEAPTWGTRAGDDLPITEAPTGYLAEQETRQAIERRAGSDSSMCRDVPMFNDFLLARSGVLFEQQEAHPRAFGWRRPARDEDCRDRLFVAPSSALPHDVDRIMPVLYDELHAGFLEARLEWFLAWTIARWPEIDVVVFDTPPTLVGLSRAVLSMALRLPRRISLSDEDETPPPLDIAEVDWKACVVVTPDQQDLRASERWLGAIPEQEADALTIVVNRAERGRGDLLPSLRADLASDDEPDPGLPLALTARSYCGRLLSGEREDEGRLAVVVQAEALRRFVSPSQAPDSGTDDPLSYLDDLVEALGRCRS